MLVWSQQSTHSYEELAKCLACFALTSSVGERTGDMIQGYLRLRKVAKFTANMKERNGRWLHSALLDGHGCRSARATDYQRLPDADLNGSDKAVHFLASSKLEAFNSKAHVRLIQCGCAANIRLATGLKPFNFQHEGKWPSYARAIDTKPTGRQSQVIWNFAFLVMGLWRNLE